MSKMRALWHKFFATINLLTTMIFKSVIEHYRWCLLLCTLLTVVSLYFTKKLELRSDFVELLPNNYQSVRDVKKAMEKIGGLGNLSIAFESANPQASMRLADDLAQVIEREFMDKIRSYEYKIDVVKNFYEQNAALYMDYADLLTIKNRLKDRIVQEERKHISILTDFLDEEEEPAKAVPELSFKDIEAKYKEGTDRFANYLDGYYTGEDGHLLAMFIKPKTSHSSMVDIKELIEGLEQAINKLNPRSYAEDMRYGFAGSHKMNLEEFEILKKDIFGTLALCFSLIGLAILIFFRKLRAVLLLGIACMAAVCWTFMGAYLGIGYLSVATAFLGAIIAGTGINYGIIMLARYFEEKRLRMLAGPCADNFAESKKILLVALEKTKVATFGAAATTMVAFGIFVIAEVKSFSEFGFIGSLGIILVWCASYTLLPALILLAEKIWPSYKESPQKGKVKRRALSFFKKDFINADLNLSFLTNFLERFHAPILIVFCLLSIISVILFIRYLPDSLEYNMSNLRTKSGLYSGTAKLDQRVGEISHTSQTPAIILAQDIHQSLEICAALDEVREQKGSEAGIGDCHSIYSYLPKEQAKKLPVVKEIKRLLHNNLLQKSLDAKALKDIAEFQKSLPAKLVELSDIPEPLARYFKDKEGQIGKFVYVDPRPGMDLWQSKNLVLFTNDVREVKLKSGEVITSSGESVIFADLLKLIRKDTPVTTLLSFIGVFAVVLVLFGRLRSAIFVSLALLSGTFMMLGLVALLKIKFNFLNFVALPMTFGIGVDYAINIFQRYVEEGRGSMEKVLKRTGLAVILCSLTTVIGYLTLIFADSQALISLGFLAIVGEITCIIAAMIFLPTLVIYCEKKFTKQSLT